MMNLYSLHKSPASLFGYEARLKIPNFLWIEVSQNPSLLQNPEHRKTLAKTAFDALRYALKTKAPFPEGEAAIAEDPFTAEKYASSVLKAPFPKGEAAIATDPYLSCSYANNALNGRPFPAGEPAMAKAAETDQFFNTGLATRYAENVLGYPNPKSWASDYRKKHNL